MLSIGKFARLVPTGMRPSNVFGLTAAKAPISERDIGMHIEPDGAEHEALSNQCGLTGSECRATRKACGGGQ